MIKNRVIVVFAIIACVIAVVGFGSRLKGGPSKPITKIDPSRALGREPKPFPDDVTYAFLFRHIHFLVEKKIPDSQLYTLLQMEYGINATQAEKLKQVALSTVEEVKLQDMRANEIIAQVRARYPTGIVPHGQTAPSIPLELIDAQKARKGMILRARSELKATLGDDSFNRFDEKLKTRIQAASVRQTSFQN